MGIEEKMKNAKTSTWVTDGMPKWRVLLNVYFGKFKGRILVAIRNCKKSKT